MWGCEIHRSTRKMIAKSCPEQHTQMGSLILLPITDPDPAPVKIICLALKVTHSFDMTAG
jgi:hypothetical protein